MNEKNALLLDVFETKACPACGREHSRRLLFKLRNTNLYQCVCGLKFIDPSLTEESMMQIYQSTEELSQVNPVLSHYYEYETLNPASKTHRDYIITLKRLASYTKGRFLLEIGCGYGSFLKVAQGQGWEVLGVDSSSENIEALQKKRIRGICSDFLKLKCKFRFDVIVLWDLIEHPRNPVAFLRKTYDLLKPNGLVVIATPYDPNLLSVLATWLYQLSMGKIRYPIEKFYVIEHTSYFNLKTLKDLLDLGNFQLLCSWKTETDIVRYQLPRWSKFFAKTSFLFARLLHLQNRIILIARKRD